MQRSINHETHQENNDGLEMPTLMVNVEGHIVRLNAMAKQAVCQHSRLHDLVANRHKEPLSHALNKARVERVSPARF